MVVIIDGNNAAYRAYYAHKDLSAKVKDKTIKTGLTYGFLDIFATAIEKAKLANKSHTIYVAWDKGRNRRNKIDPTYKADRDVKIASDPKAQAERKDIYEQIILLQKILITMGMHQVYKAGEEADDIVGSLSKICNDRGEKVLLISGDHDYFQLINDNTKLYLARTKSNFVYDAVKFEQQYEITPEQYIDIMTLAGDSSDNIKGLPKVGEKTAFDIIKKNPDLVNNIVYKGDKNPNIEGLSDNKKKLILDNIDHIIKTHKLVKIEKNITELNYLKGKKNLNKLESGLEALKFLSILNDDDKWELLQNICEEEG